MLKPNMFHLARVVLLTRGNLTLVNGWLMCCLLANEISYVSTYILILLRINILEGYLRLGV